MSHLPLLYNQGTSPFLPPPYIPPKVGILGISSLGPHSMLRSHSSGSKPHPFKSLTSSIPSPQKAWQLSAPPLGAAPYTGYLGPGSHICYVIPLLPSWRSPRNCFALFIKPGFNNSGWMAYYISGDWFPVTGDSEFITAHLEKVHKFAFSLVIKLGFHCPASFLTRLILFQ